MKKSFYLIVFLLPLFTYSQTNKSRGIFFENKITNWDSVLLKAKAENKYIFVDCFTTWCKPCKELANNVFPQKKVSDFFNKNFINISLQLNETKNDNAVTVKKRGILKHIEQLTKINAYPTFLIFDNTGKLVHKVAGGGDDANKFIDKIKQSLNKEEQYYTLIEKLKAGDTSEVLIKKLCYKAREANDNTDLFIKAFVDKQ